jgi:hypothetical protein
LLEPREPPLLEPLPPPPVFPVSLGVLVLSGASPGGTVSDPVLPLAASPLVSAPALGCVMDWGVSPLTRRLGLAGGADLLTIQLVIIVIAGQVDPASSRGVTCWSAFSL